MTFGVLALLLLAMCVADARRWRGLARTCAGLAVLLFFAVGCGPVPAWLLTRLQAPYAVDAPIAWAPRNAIVLLGAGALRIPSSGRAEPSLFAHGRIARAAMLYRVCKLGGHDCRIEVSGGDAMGTGASEAAVYAVELQRLGVPPADLLLEPHSMNTWQNAQFSAPLLKDYGAQRVLLVSSATHLRRASLYFARFGIAATPIRADWVNARWSWWPQSWNFAVTDLALHERIGVARYHLYDALGWNVTATKPGAL